MLIPPGLHFDPLAAAAAVDPTKIKKYDMPYKGQTFVQLHQGGTHVIVGTVVGFDFRMDRQGNLVEWRASIDCKLTNSFSFANGATWRDASEWHPAPDAQQEGADDLRGAIAALSARLGDIELRLNRPTEADESKASVKVLDAARADIETLKERVRALTTPVTIRVEDRLGNDLPASALADTPAPAKQPLPRFGRKPPANDAPVK